MKRSLYAFLISCFATMSFVTCAATNTVVKTMVVNRCQYVIGDGRQCVYQTEDGNVYCWRHRGVVKAVGEAFQDAGKGAGCALASTVQWSTNAWNATKGAADGMRVGIVELFGGKDAKKECNQAVSK